MYPTLTFNVNILPYLFQICKLKFSLPTFLFPAHLPKVTTILKLETSGNVFIHFNVFYTFQYILYIYECFYTFSAFLCLHKQYVLLIFIFKC